jgi:hypothetical protein
MGFLVNAVERAQDRIDRDFGRLGRQLMATQGTPCALDQSRTAKRTEYLMQIGFRNLLPGLRFPCCEQDPARPAVRAQRVLAPRSPRDLRRAFSTSFVLPLR